MTNFTQNLLRVLAYSALLIGTVSAVGCGPGVRVGYRAYDPYRSDYHIWDGNEVNSYSQWESGNSSKSPNQ